MKIKTITNYLSINEANRIYKSLIKSFRSIPKHSTDIFEEEERCLSAFYTKMMEVSNNICEGA
jgi:histone H3/H4